MVSHIKAALPPSARMALENSEVLKDNTPIATFSSLIQILQALIDRQHAQAIRKPNAAESSKRSKDAKNVKDPKAKRPKLEHETTVTCSYCRIKGHTEAQCFKKQRAEKRKSELSKSKPKLYELQAELAKLQSALAKFKEEK